VRLARGADDEIDLKNLTPHISFNGNCEEAINFYKEAFDGEIEFSMTYKGSPMEDQVPEDHQLKIMHSTFAADGIRFMAADSVPGHTVPRESNIDLNIDFDSKEEQAEAFRILSEGGEVLMPLQDVFWGSHFGMIRDRFGIKWMFNCPQV
jgi:PhnB protein